MTKNFINTLKIYLTNISTNKEEIAKVENLCLWDFLVQQGRPSIKLTDVKEVKTNTKILMLQLQLCLNFLQE